VALVKIALTALQLKAGNGTRTRDPNLGKVVLYQLSYSRNLSSFSRNDSANLIGKGAGMEVRGIEPLTS
jgi:hypothetical protein